MAQTEEFMFQNVLIQNWGKKKWEIFQIWWPSHNILTLKTTTLFFFIAEPQGQPQELHGRHHHLAGLEEGRRGLRVRLHRHLAG